MCYVEREVRRRSEEQVSLPSSSVLLSARQYQMLPALFDLRLGEPAAYIHAHALAWVADSNDPRLSRKLPMGKRWSWMPLPSHPPVYHLVACVRPCIPSSCRLDFPHRRSLRMEERLVLLSA